ncbi:chaperone modulator CbpM [Aliiroseovarius lamellibrachiae]|uniref:chaperone modulator CbpM n=1 Tax=Aliiroseovarius lamellibrachiae TaxID=1924933 RepID=UPI001BE0F0A3|nr:chaperone modulator CbpM [Aliiroseovarius lamellibrachiae]MBT2131585.1 hypothetical protein [Aliiroseovarius lamellibrachiae]
MTLTEKMVLTQVRRVTRRELRQWMQLGWVRPVNRDGAPMFDAMDVARVRLVRDLRNDMAVSPDAMAIILNLMDQLHRTRRDLRALAEVVADNPEAFQRTARRRPQLWDDTGSETD